MVGKVGLIIQAHMGSERLPGKVMKHVNGVSVLGHVITRLKDVKNADCIIVATSNLEVDNLIEYESLEYGATVYRGSDLDVLARYYGAAKENSIDIVARICSDNMFIDPDIVSKEIQFFIDNEYDIVTSGKSIPLGLGTEVFSFESLKEVFKKAKTPYEHEHVCPYLYEHGKVYYCEINEMNFSPEKEFGETRTATDKKTTISNCRKYRLTLDTSEDWRLINELARRVDPQKCRLSDIESVFENEPELLKINENVIQRS